MTRQRNILSRALIALTLSLTVLLIVEGLSRIMLTVRADLSSQEPDWSQYASDVGWERRPHFTGVVVGERYGYQPVQPVREFDDQGFFTVDTAQIHDTTHKHILTIGDSNTFGWGVPTSSTFSEILDDLREDALREIAERALTDPERGVITELNPGAAPLELSDEALLQMVRLDLHAAVGEA